MSSRNITLITWIDFCKAWLIFPTKFSSKLHHVHVLLCISSIGTLPIIKRVFHQLDWNIILLVTLPLLIIFHMNFRLKDLCPNLIQQTMLVKIYYKKAGVSSDSSAPLLRYFHSWQKTAGKFSDYLISSLYSLVQIDCF